MTVIPHGVNCAVLQTPPRFPGAVVLGLSIVLLLNAGCAARNPLAKQKLGKIRISADGRGFEDERGRPWAPMGVNYYRPGTGWAPQVWKKFDAEATRADFVRMREVGVNCVRVFLSWGSFYLDHGVVDPEGLAKFDQFLEIAESAGIYVHPTGPDHWEGLPNWRPFGLEEDGTVAALEEFWRQFAARYRGRNVIFAYDLRNEPEMPWTNPTLERKWGERLKVKHGPDLSRLEPVWGKPVSGTEGAFSAPSDQDSPGSEALLDYQKFREDLADRWTSRQAAAIKAADPKALVTVGLIQWSVPGVLPGSLKHYSAFRPERQARYLDFLEVHFYPFAKGAYDYSSEEAEVENMAYLESVVREVALAGKPVVLAEFGWYGGGKPRFNQGKLPASTEAQHARYCRLAVETTKPFATGWLNWGLYDQPEATDCSEFTGLFRADGTIKEWGVTFRELARGSSQHRVPSQRGIARPALNWNQCLTSLEAGRKFQKEYLAAFKAEKTTAGQ